MRIALVANCCFMICNYRRGVMRALQAAGHEIVVVAAEDDYTHQLADDGIPWRSLPLDGKGLNPFLEARAIYTLFRVLRQERVDFALSYSAKGNVYAGFATAFLPTRQIANITGLGSTFIKQSALTALMKWLYRLAFARTALVFFQNDDDRQFFLDNRMARAQRSERIPGSGIDLSRFHPAPAVARNGTTVFLLMGRMLWDKGVAEYVQAARSLRKRGIAARFQLLGPVGFANPTAITQRDMDAWIAEGIIEYLGSTEDVRPHMAAADCIVLPSYREGMPRSILEAGAMAKPVIATDVPGCRHAVVDGVTGVLCRVQDAGDLAAKMEVFLNLPAEARTEMGSQGRQKMEREFDERIVIDRYLSTIDRLAQKKKSFIGDYNHQSPPARPRDQART